MTRKLLETDQDEDIKSYNVKKGKKKLRDHEEVEHDENKRVSSEVVSSCG